MPHINLDPTNQFIDRFFEANSSQHYQSSTGDPSPAERVKSCVAHYSAPCYTHLAYRIWNAVKSLFGLSDWQLATQSLKDVLNDEVGEDQLANTVEIRDKISRVMLETLITAPKDPQRALSSGIDKAGPHWLVGKTQQRINLTPQSS